MSVRLSVKRRARKDLSDYATFIGERDPAAADRFLNAFSASAERLVQQPAIGSSRWKTRPSLHDVRAWPVKGYEQFIIYYRYTGSVVQVLRVLRGSVPPETVLRTPE